MNTQTIHDVASAAVTLLLIAGDILLIAHGSTVPPELTAATGLAVGYTFRSVAVVSG